MIALRVEAVLGDDDQLAGERRAFRWHRQAFQALIISEGFEIVRHLNRLAARGKPVAAIFEAHNLFDAFDTDIGLAVDLGERFGLELEARGQWLTVFVHDARVEPGAFVGESKKMAAVELDMDGGNSAERFV
jgi:hypothetical protein